MSMKEYKKDFINFLECGFIAVNQADEDAAIKLFKAASLTNPESTFPKIGLGYLHLHKLELTEAKEAFEWVVKKEPNNEMAKSFLGIVMTMTPSDVMKGEKLLVQTEKSEDKEIKKLSSTALDFVERFIKKEPTPLEGKKRK